MKDTNNDYQIWKLIRYIFLFTSVDDTCLHRTQTSIHRANYDLPGCVGNVGLVMPMPVL